MGILTDTFARREQRNRFGAVSPESNSFDSNSPRSWADFLVGPRSSSGVRITTDSALNFSPWFRGLDLISSGIGKVSKRVMRRTDHDDDGIADGSTPAREHVAYRMLLSRPNEFQTAFEFAKLLTLHAISPGNGYAYIERDKQTADPISLLPLDPHTTFPVRETRGGRLWYSVDVGEDLPRKIPAENMLHIHSLSMDGLKGIDTIGRASDGIGGGIASRLYGNAFFRNSARPSVVLATDQIVPDKVATQVIGGWERMVSGIENAHRTTLLDRGLKATQLSLSPEQAQLILGQQFNLIDVANYLGLHPWYLGYPGSTGYNGLEQISLGLLADTFDPWLVRWEQECTRKLLTEQEQADDSHFVQCNRHELIRSSRADSAAYWRIAVGGPFATPNEARADMGMNPSDDVNADAIHTPLNQTGSDMGGDNFPKGAQ